MEEKKKNIVFPKLQNLKTSKVVSSSGVDGFSQVGDYFALSGKAILEDADPPIVKALIALMEETFRRNQVDVTDDFRAQIESIAKEKWDRIKRNIKEGGISEQLNRLFSSKTKKEAEGVASEIVIRRSEFAALIMNAKDHGFEYTHHSVEFLPPGVGRVELPDVALLRDSAHVEMVGETEMSAGEIKRTIEQRRKNNAHLFEREGEWHCIFFTFRDADGLHYKVPHVHYVSHLWGLAKEDVWKELRKKEYAVPNVHIRFEG